MNEFKTTAAMEMYIQTGRNVEHDLTVRGFQELCESQFTWDAPVFEDDAWTLQEDQSTISVEMEDFDMIPKSHLWTVDVEGRGIPAEVQVQLKSFGGTRAVYGVRLL